MSSRTVALTAASVAVGIGYIATASTEVLAHVPLRASSASYHYRPQAALSIIAVWYAIANFRQSRPRRWAGFRQALRTAGRTITRMTPPTIVERATLSAGEFGAT